MHIMAGSGPVDHDARAHILVVEDERALRAIVSDALRDEGYSVAEAWNGADAMAAMRQRLPDLVLLDIDLPLVNGCEFLQARAHDPALAAVPVLVVSAAYRLLDVLQGVTVQGILAKPFDVEVLLATVTAIVEQRHTSNLRPPALAVASGSLIQVAPRVGPLPPAASEPPSVPQP